MNKSTICSLILGLSIATVANAVDSDPGYGPRAEGGSAGRATTSKGSRLARSTYLKPTQHFYGKGYVVAYRYVKWNERAHAVDSTGFENSMFYLPTNAARSAVESPRVTRYYGKQTSGTSLVPAPAPASGKSSGSPAESAAKPVPPIAGESAQ